ncbi:hypothetical protein F2Q69_00013996 [Brassica cretica]|uniref:Uncharacterized protein n=1 Tax=Brassica cretica TaxID=69181 RepID=A0A8S9QFD2_BRACR|nr:hypothetical protein F2Q69_00013996 [Brassica cretica]
METSINVGNNRLAVPSGINCQTAPLDFSASRFFRLSIFPPGKTPILAPFFTPLPSALHPSALQSIPDLK